MAESACQTVLCLVVLLTKRQIPLRYRGRRPASACRVRVACVSKSSRKPAANRSATRFDLSRHVEIVRTCLQQVCDLDSVMELGLSYVLYSSIYDAL